MAIPLTPCFSLSYNKETVCQSEILHCSGCINTVNMHLKNSIVAFMVIVIVLENVLDVSVSFLCVILSFLKFSRKVQNISIRSQVEFPKQVICTTVVL